MLLRLGLGPGLICTPLSPLPTSSGCIDIAGVGLERDLATDVVDARAGTGHIARPVSPWPPFPSVQRWPVLAWNAISPPSLMLGLVFGAICAPESRGSPPWSSVVQRLPLPLAWNATSPHKLTLGLVPGDHPGPRITTGAGSLCPEMAAARLNRDHRVGLRSRDAGARSCPGHHHRDGCAPPPHAEHERFADHIPHPTTVRHRDPFAARRRTSSTTGLQRFGRRSSANPDLTDGRASRVG